MGHRQMLQVLEALWADMVALPAIALFLSLFTFWRWWLTRSWAEADSRAGLLSFLRRPDAPRLYQRCVCWALEKTDDWVLDEHQRQLPRSFRPAWSLRLFHRALLVALIYPTGCILVQWAWGVDVSFDQLERWDVWFYSDVYRGFRWSALAAFAVWLLSFVLLNRSRYIAAAFAVSLLAALVVASAQIVPRSIDGYGGTGASLMVALSTAALLCAGAPAAVPLSALSGFVFSRLALNAVGGSVYATALDFLNALGLDAARPLRIPLITILTVVLSTAAVAPLFRRAPSVGLRGFMVTGTTIAAVIGVAYLFPLGLGWRGLSAVLSLGLFLPLVNAAFDFLSFGLTRWALRKGVDNMGWRTPGWGAADLFLGVIVMLALGTAFIVFLQLQNAILGFPLTQLDRFFEQVRVQPENWYWLGAAIGSTMLPTLVHITLAVWSIGPVVLTPRRGRAIADRLEKSDAHFGWRWTMLTALAAWSATAVAAPLIFIAFALDWIVSSGVQVLQVWLDALEWIAALVPGP